MLRGLFVFGSTLVVFGAVAWHLLLREGLYVTLGIGRNVQTIDKFPYTCRKILEEGLTGCEDLWLDDQERLLYAACATTQGRLAWSQAVDRLNVSARRPSGTEFLALSIDHELPNASFPIHPISLGNYVSPIGDSSVDFLGFDAEIINEHIVHFYLVNQRPPVDAQRKYLDASKIGANSTIEVFEHNRGSSGMRHLRTIWAPREVYTPNNVAAVGGGAFVVTNDHSPVGIRKSLDSYIGGGGVAFCSASGKCEEVTPPRTFKMPNGLARGLDGHIYVPSTISGTISVYALSLSESNDTMPTFTLLDTINVGMPLDNLALDADGDLWAAGFPDGVKLIQWVKEPVEMKAPGTVWRIRKNLKGFIVEKVLEDRDAEFLNGITTVRHDSKTGRLFMGGAFNEFVVCVPNV